MGQRRRGSTRRHMEKVLLGLEGRGRGGAKHWKACKKCRKMEVRHKEADLFMDVAVWQARRCALLEQQGEYHEVRQCMQNCSM